MQSASLKDQVKFIDRETTAFVRDGLSVLVWCDFLPGLFSRGRVVHTDSIKHWISAAGEEVRGVTPSEKEEIVAALKEHHGSWWRTVEIEP